MKNKIFIRMLAAVLVLCLVVPADAALAVQLFPDSALGRTAEKSAISIAPGGRLNASSFINPSSQRLTEFYIENLPGTAAVPIVEFGSKLYGKSTLTQVAAYLAGKGKRVVAAINADFFFTETGLPIGMVMKEGRLCSSEGDEHAIGFNADGTAFISKPQLTMSAAGGENNSKRVSLVAVNRKRDFGGAYLFTSDFSSTTRVSTEGYEVVLKDLSGPLKIGTPLTATVESITKSKTASSLPEGKMVISIDTAKSTAAQVDAVKALAVGERVEINITSPDERWRDAVYSVGAGAKEILIENGVITPGLSSTAEPRSAFGVREDGTVIMYAMDGRRSGYSSGVGLDNLARRLYELGCVYAINLDGGGSTAVAAMYPGDSELTVINRPSDGSLRACANYIFLVNNAAPTGTPEKLFIYPYDLNILKGASVKFSIKATDRNFIPVAAPSGVSMAVNGIADDYSSAIGSIDASGLFYAEGAGAGEITMWKDFASGTANVRVVDDVTDIRLYNDTTGAEVSALSINPDTNIKLRVAAYTGDTALVSQNSCFLWEADAVIGSIDQSGLFTAAQGSGINGSIRISYGAFTKELPVTVGKSPVVVESFEGEAYGLSANGSGAFFTPEAAMVNVRFGFRAGRIDYTIDVNADIPEATLPASIALSQNPSRLDMYVSGDMSGNTLYALLRDASGGTFRTELTKLDFSGYRRVGAAISNAASIYGFAIAYNGGEKTAGAFYVDQITAGYAADADTGAPSIAFQPVTLIDGVINVEAALFDSFEKTVRPDNISLSADGRPVSFSYNQASGRLTAAVQDDGSGAVKRFTVIAADSSGNRSRAAAEYVSETPLADRFTDISGHWSRQYANYMFDMGIMSGYAGDSGLVFRPEKEVTRAEFCVAMIKWMRIDPSLYETFELPYADLANIPESVLPFARAAYAKGYIGGKLTNGETVFDGNAPLTRAEVITILGRALDRGYAPAEISFSDFASVPSWAAPFVKTLIGTGSIGGYTDGTVKPENHIKNSELAKILYTLV